MSESLNHFVGAALRELEDDREGGVLGEVPGERIDRYTLVECLGEGGFGKVWLAEQEKPVRRQVALKVIKLGMDTREVVARFGMERQALAVMDHPGIAKVFDAGATPSGRPYFVMERVRGERITRYCDEAKLPLRDRLELFIGVCQAVGHAHQKGVIHRDLKPSNLLVTETDGKPVPKVIDFGIAKATDGDRLSEQTLVTRADRLMGTPAYMSPEQSEPGRDVDTRTDIFSLGVVLYELITGKPPAGPRDPSTTIKRPSAAMRAVARESRAPEWIGQVKGDLDRIVMKAIDHDRERRYESADALASDLRAFLEHRPVTARAPTLGYLARRFARRHLAATVASLVVVLVLVAGVTVSTILYLRANEALHNSRQVTRFLKDTLGQVEASRSLGRDTTMMREILDQTADRLGAELKDQPRVEVELRAIIARTYMDLGEYDKAVEQSSAVLKLERRIGSGDREEMAVALHEHAKYLQEAGHPKEAEAYGRRTLAMRQRLFGDGDSRTLQTHAELAWTLMRAGRAREGEASARLAVEAWRKNPEDPLLSGAPSSLAAILHHLARHEESLALFQELLEQQRRQYGPEHPKIAGTLSNVGMQLCRMERFGDAEPFFTEGLRQERLFYKDRMPNGWYLLRGLMRVEGGRGDWARQMAYAREAYAEVRKFHPPGHQHYRWTTDDLTKVMIEQAERDVTARPAEALTLLDELAGNKDFASQVEKNAAWLDCLRGAASEDDALIERGIQSMKAKEKPGTEDLRRLAVAAGME